MAKFKKQVLRLDTPDAKLVKLLAGKPKRDAIVSALGAAIDPAAPPEWIALATDDLDDVVHLAPPLFFAKAADGDVFYDDHCAGHVVYCSGKQAEKFGDDRGGGTVIEISDAKSVTAFQTEGEVVLYDFRWFEPAPVTTKDFAALMRAADKAFHGELAGYDSPDDGVPPSVVATGEVGGCYLGDQGRTGCYATTGPKKLPKPKWRADFDFSRADEFGGGLVVADGQLYAASSWARRTIEIGALDVAGKKRWAIEPSKSQAWPETYPTIANGVCYLGTNHGLYALEAATGKQLWQAKSARSTTRAMPVVVGDVVIVPAKKQVLALATATGKKAWSVAIKGEPRQLAAGGGLVYVLADDAVLAIDPATKKAKWSLKGEPCGIGPVFIGGVVLTGGPRSKLQAIDAATGKRAWTSKTTISGSHPIAVGDGTIVAYDENNTLCALVLATGKHLWTAKHSANFSHGRCAPAIAGGVVYAGISDAGEDDYNALPVLAAFDLKTGKELWRMTAMDKDKSYPQELRLDSSPVLHDGKLYVATNKGTTCLL